MVNVLMFQALQLLMLCYQRNLENAKKLEDIEVLNQGQQLKGSRKYTLYKLDGSPHIEN